MTYYVRDGRLEKKRKAKDMAWPIASQYDMTKDITMSQPKGWQEHYNVEDKAKGRVYREYLNSPWKTRGWNMVGIKDEKTTRGNDKTTKITLNSKRKKMLNKRAK